MQAQYQQSSETLQNQTFRKIIFAICKVDETLQSSIPQCLETNVFNACALPVTTYGAETICKVGGEDHQFDRSATWGRDVKQLWTAKLNCFIFIELHIPTLLCI